MDSALLEMRLIRKRFGEVLVLHCVNLDVRAGRSPCAGGRERGRQEHADADRRRHPRAGRRHDDLRRPTVRAQVAGRRPAGRHRHGPPGVEPGPRLDRGREHSDGLGAAAVAMVRRSEEALRPRRRDARRVLSRRRSVRRRRLARHGLPAGGRDPQGPRLEPEDHHLRRTDFRAWKPTKPSWCWRPSAS